MVLVIKEPKPSRVSKPKSINLVPAEDSAASREKTANNEITILINKITTFINTLATSELESWTINFI